MTKDKKKTSRKILAAKIKANRLNKKAPSEIRAKRQAEKAKKPRAKSTTEKIVITVCLNKKNNFTRLSKAQVAALPEEARKYYATQLANFDANNQKKSKKATARRPITRKTLRTERRTLKRAQDKAQKILEKAAKKRAAQQTA